MKAVANRCEVKNKQTNKNVELMEDILEKEIQRNLHKNVN